MTVFNANTVKELANSIYEQAIGFSELKKGIFVDKKRKEFVVYTKNSIGYDRAIRLDRYEFVGTYDYGAMPVWIEQDINHVLKKLLPIPYVRTSWPANLMLEEE